MIAGQDAETPGIHGDRLAQAELHAEVGDARERPAGVMLSEPAGRFQPGGPCPKCSGQEGFEGGVGRQLIETRAGNVLQEGEGPARPVPYLRVNPRPQSGHFGIGGPAQIESQID